MRRNNRMAPVDFEDLDDRKAAYDAAGTERMMAVRGAPRNMFSVPVAGNKTYDATGLVEPTVAPAASAPTGDVMKTDAFGLPTTRLERERRKKQVKDDVMAGYKMSPQGQAAEALAKKKRAPVFLAEKAKSEDVLFLKDFLRDQGHFVGESTDYFDAATTEAVKAFQKQQGLKPDGLVGDKTLTALREVQAKVNNEALQQYEIDKLDLGGSLASRDDIDNMVGRARSTAGDIFRGAKANPGARKMASDAETLSEEAVSFGKQSMTDAAGKLRAMGETAQQGLIDRGVVTADQLNTILRYF